MAAEGTMRKGTAKKLHTIPAASSPQEHLWKHIEALDLPDIQAYREWCRAQDFGAGLNKDWRQRQQERLRAKKLAEQARARRERLSHIHQLSLKSWEEYDAWCLSRGFSIALNKSPQQLAQEIQTVQRERAAIALTQSKMLRRKPKDFVLAVFAGRIAASDLRNDAERELVRYVEGYYRKDAVTREALLRLMLRFGCDLDLLTEWTAAAHPGWQENNCFLNGLGHLARLHSAWLRAPETWKAEFESPRRRFGSLARHLLARYPVPALLDAAWFEDDTCEGEAYRSWFVHIGSGQNIRTACLPFPLTKMAAHHFIKAPGDATIIGALRWGQVLGMGGSARLAKAVIGSRLNEIQDDEPFWATVLRFFVNNPMLDPAQIGPIVDYLHNQKYVPQEIIGQGGRVEHTGPPQPNFAMKGRSATALLRLVEEWHRRLAQEKRPSREWQRAGIQEFSLLQREGLYRETLWTITELLSTKELLQEGRFMSNCVATYAESCARGQSSIWSLRKRAGGESRSVRVMTVEVCCASRQIVQARGRFNRTPDYSYVDPYLKAAPDVLRHWAAAQNLTLSEYAW